MAGSSQLESPLRWSPTATFTHTAPQVTDGDPRGEQPSPESLSSASTSKAPSNSWAPANSSCHPVSLSLPCAASHCRQALAFGGGLWLNLSHLTNPFSCNCEDLPSMLSAVQAARDDLKPGVLDPVPISDSKASGAACAGDASSSSPNTRLHHYSSHTLRFPAAVFAA